MARLRTKAPLCPRLNKGAGYAYKYLGCRCDVCRSYHNDSRSIKEREAAKERSKIWRRNNLERSRATVKAYQARNPDWMFSQALKKYGLTLKGYNELLSRQGGVCAICLGDEPNTHQYTRLAVDHCHLTNKVRGLLCSQCNTAIGKLRHSVYNLKRAIYYLAQSGDITGE